MSDDENNVKKAPTAVDLDELQFEDDTLGSDFDPEADPFSGSAPPPDGIHVVTLSLNTNQAPTGILSGRAKNGQTYAIVEIQAKISAPGEPHDNRVLFDSVNTFVFDGACEIAGVLQALGVEVPPNVGKRELVGLLVEALQGEPQCRVESEWTASVQKEDGKYKTVKRGMRKFPKKEDGSGHQHVLVIEGDRVKARGEIIRYLTLEEVAAAA